MLPNMNDNLLQHKTKKVIHSFIPTASASIHKCMSMCKQTGLCVAHTDTGRLAGGGVEGGGDDWQGKQNLLI